MRHLIKILTACASLLAGAPCALADLRVAVASNFVEPARLLAAAHAAAGGPDWRISHGASGALAAQIENGAPFDLFLSADVDRPEYLDKAGKALAIATYAIGRLALVLPAENTGPYPEVLEPLRIALPDPVVAPYGQAAELVLLDQGYASAGSGMTVARKPKNDGPERPPLDIVLTPNVSAAASFFAVGAVDAAFVAVSLVPAISAQRSVQVIGIDGGHPPIRQGMALLSDAQDAREAFEWLQSDAAREIILQAGYNVPERE